MPKGQNEWLFRLLESVLQFIDNAWRIRSFKSRMLKSLLLVIVLLLMAAATHLHYPFHYHISHSTEPSIQTNLPLPAHDWHFLLPRKIWQIYLAPPNVNKTNLEIDPKQLSATVSWLARNPEYQYILVDDEGAEAFVLQHFENNPTILRGFMELRNPGMKSDLLRYLILLVNGGVYSDIDTVNLKPIGLWMPEKYGKDTRVVIGVEFDRLDGSNWGEVHPDLQFCQWTIAATPGHKLFSYMAEWAISELEAFTKARQTTYSEFNFSSSDVMQLTGPAAWTDAVFRQLQEYEPELTSLRNLSGLTEPKLVGDILILPIDGFGMGQPHSNSTADGSVPATALVQHQFRGTWRHEHRSPHKAEERASHRPGVLGRQL